MVTITATWLMLGNNCGHRQKKPSFVPDKVIIHTAAGAPCHFHMSISNLTSKHCTVSV